MKEFFVNAKVSRWLQMWKSYLSSAFFVSGCYILVYVAQNVENCLTIFDRIFGDIQPGLQEAWHFLTFSPQKNKERKEKNTFLKVK